MSLGYSGCEAGYMGRWSMAGPRAAGFGQAGVWRVHLGLDSCNVGRRPTLVTLCNLFLNWVGLLPTNRAAKHLQACAIVMQEKSFQRSSVALLLPLIATNQVNANPAALMNESVHLRDSASLAPNDCDVPDHTRLCSAVSALKTAQTALPTPTERDI